MATGTAVGAADSAYRVRQHLFVASCIALIATAMTFAIRADIMGALEGQFALDKTQLGWIAGAAFWGFALSIVIGGPLCDALGMGRLLFLAFLCHAGGVALTIWAPGFALLFTGTLALGLGNGLVEAVINPLVATVYPDAKTAKLNALHAWFPGGIVIGGLVAFALSKAAPALHLGPATLWQVKMATIWVPTLIYGLLFIGRKFPKTERVASGVPTSHMFREALRPLFIVWIFSMLLTASTELVPNQWIPNILTSAIPGIAAASILVLVWINGVMAVGRMFAGPIVHKLSPTGLLIGSACFSLVGLLWLSFVHSSAVAFAAATVFAVGICYFWPTMLGVTSERFPKGGALLLGMMGAAGNLSVAIGQPIAGKIQDQYIAQAMGGAVPATGATPAAMAFGGAMALRYITILPLLLIVIFTIIYLRDRARGGYKIVKLGQEEEPAEVPIEL